SALYVLYREPASPCALVLAGAAGTAAVLFKPIALPPVVFILAAWVLGRYLRHGALRSALKECGSIFLGAVSVAVLTFAYFLLHGAGPAMWQSVVQYNVYYLRSNGSSITFLLKYSGLFCKNWWI